MKRILHLVRHGQVDRTAPRTDEMGWGLTPLGRDQAALTAQRLRTLHITAIHYSSLRRAAETAHIISEGFPNVPLYPSKLLWECVPYVSQPDG